NPRDVKFDFAKEIVGRFHGADAAQESATGFVARFRHGELPEDLAEKIVQVPKGESGSSVVRVLKDSGLVPSANEAVRMIEQGGVRIEGEKVADRNLVLERGKTL